MSATGLPTLRSTATSASPSSGRPVWHTNTATMNWPCTSFGSHGAGGARRSTATLVSSRGAAAESSRYASSTCTASSPRHAMAPPRISGPTGKSRYSNEVTMPKLPPPPRSAQNSSAFSSADARTSAPSAVTTSIDTSVSQV